MSLTNNKYLLDGQFYYKNDNYNVLLNFKNGFLIDGTYFSHNVLGINNAHQIYKNGVIQKLTQLQPKYKIFDVDIEYDENGRIIYEKSDIRDHKLRSLKLNAGSIYVYQYGKIRTGSRDVFYHQSPKPIHVIVKLRVPENAGRVPFILNSLYTTVDTAIVEDIYSVKNPDRHYKSPDLSRIGKVNLNFYIISSANLS